MDYIETGILIAHDYEIELTGDQSPTLRILHKESMHNRRGAAAESVYLYYEAMIRYGSLINQKPESVSLHILSFGFGLGYNEILTVIFFLKNNWSLDRLYLFSKEKDVSLYNLFNNWLSATVDSGSIFDDVYLGIERAMVSFGGCVSKTAVKEKMRWLLNRKQWIQDGPVASISDFKDVYDVVFYDAFSSKINENLWSESFLSDLFRARLSQSYVFSTYACTGVLKRLAAASDAQFVKRDGYMGKRNASMVFRDR